MPVMSGRFVMSAFLALASIFLFLQCAECAGHGDALECTLGRLFIADQTESVVHVLDLDSIVDGVYEEVGPLSVHAPLLGLQSTETELATIMTRDRSDTTALGRVGFLRPGFTAVQHGVHTHVEKSAPSVASFTISGWRPTHLTSSEGFISVFMDGAAPVHNSSAVFARESDVVAESGTAALIEVPLDGAHHGVSYALDEDRFLVTVTPEEDLWGLPDFFMVTDANGAVTHSIGGHDHPICPDYHGAAHIDHDWVLGCAEAGLLSVTYDHGSQTPSWNLLPFPALPGNAAWRTSTIHGHETGEVFVADLSQLDAMWSPPPPFYLIPVAKGATSIPAENLVMVNRSATMQTHCTFMLDRAAHGSEVMLLVLHSDGYLQVVPLSSTGRPGTAMHVQINETLDCSITWMVTGYGWAYIVTGGHTRDLYTVNLHEVALGHMDHAVTHMELDFTPGQSLAGGVALSLPPSLACNAHGHSHHETTSTAAPEINAAPAPPVVGFGVLLNLAALLLQSAVRP